MSAHVSLQLALALSMRDFRNLHSADFPLPVGMQIAIHKRTGYTHSVASTSTVECDIQKPTVSNRPSRTAIGGMLIALAII